MLKEFELGKSRVREVEELAQGHTAKERQRWDSDSGVCATWLCPSYAGKAERSFGFLGMSPSAMVSTQGGVGGEQQLLSWHLLFYLQWFSSSHQGVFALAKLEMASVVPGCPSGSILEGAIFLGPAQPGGQDFLGWGKGLTWGVREVLNPGVPKLHEGTHTQTHTLVRARLSRPLTSCWRLEVDGRCVRGR